MNQGERSGVVIMPTLPPIGQSAFPEGRINDRLISSGLLSNTTVCEASRLLLEPFPGPDWDMRGWHGQRRNDALRVCDLMSLIDSAVLHERIYHLPASLPDDVPRLELRNRLIEIGALTSLPRGDEHNLIGEALLASLSTVSGYQRMMGDASDIGAPLSFDKFRPGLIKALGLTTVIDQTTDKPALYGLVEWDDFERGTWGEAVGAESFDDAARDLIGSLDYAVSGAYESSMASLRAMYYVFASEHYGLPYLASADAQKMQRGFPNYFKPSVREQLYQQLAAALQTTVNTVAQEFDGPIFFIPPFSALVLDRAATPAEILSEMLALRAEYSDFRRKMSELERDRLEARSLNDRMKALRQIERLGKEVARPFDEPSRVKLEPALRYIPDAVEVVANPTNPAGWARMLLGLPTEALLSWYRRRPVAKLVRAGRAVGALPGYDGLLKKHFGDALTSAALKIQSRLQEL
jgi:hypothetical protein